MPGESFYMALTTAQLLSDQALAYTDFPTETITIDGVDYQCLLLENRQGSQWDIGGEVPQKSLQVSIERSGISTMPTEGLAVTFRSTSYRVGEVDQSDASSSVIIEIRHPTL